MNALQQVLDALQADVTRLTDEHQEAARKVEAAKLDMQQKWNRLCAATNLLGSLSAYKDTWLTPEERT